MVDVSRLILATALLLVAAAAFAVEEDCSVLPAAPPAEPYQYTLTSSNCSFSKSGGSISAAGPFTSLAALQAAATAASTMCGASGCTLSTLTYCGISGGAARYDQRLLTIPGGTPKHQPFNIAAGGSTTCEVPETDDEACGGTDVAVGQGRSDGDDAEDIWGLVRISGETWNDAVATVPDCIDSTDGDSCQVTGIYKTGPGKDKEPDGSYSFLANIRLGGGACPTGSDVGGEEFPAAPDEIPEGETCDTSDAGVEYCHPSDDGKDDETGCGYYNDNLTCLDAVEDDECWVDLDGSRYCGENAPLPPVPDNGTPGVPADPDDEIIDPDTDNEYDYYDPTTVGGSDRPPGDSGANPNRPGSTNPSTPSTPTAPAGGGGGSGTGGEGTGDGSASGGLTCDEPPLCDDDPVQCAVLQQAWRIRCVEEESDIANDLGFTEEEQAGELGDGEEPIDIGSEWSEAGPLGSLSCPEPFNVTVWGTSVSIDVWEYGCDMATFFAPFVLAMGWLIGGLMLIRGI